MDLKATPRRISVIVPTRDRLDFLPQALASIRALEGPEYTFEILVGDNGFAAETRLIAEKFGANYIKVDRTGAGAARNAGLEAATGDYLAFLDDDDVWMSTHLRDQLAILDARPDVDAVIGQAVSTDAALQPISKPWPQESPGEGDELLRKMLSGFFPQIGTTVARIQVREMIGSFDEKLIGGQDLDWLLRIARRRTLSCALAPCVLFRQRPPGSYDALQRKRVGFDRRVFLRHALPEWRIWGSPKAFIKAYSGTLIYFYWYFVWAALDRANAGQRVAAARCVISAIAILPWRAAYDVVAPGALRTAIRAILFGPKPSRAQPTATS